MPVRRYLILVLQRGMCKCGCGKPVYAARGHGTEIDHEPALILRNVNARGTDYIPPQHSIDHLDAYAGDCPNRAHRKKTSGSGATTAGTDIGKHKKERRRHRKPKPKRKWPKGRKLQGRGFQKRPKP